MTAASTSTRVAVVTGANRGIGREVCRQLADTGVQVVLTARRGERARAAAEALSSAGAVAAYPGALEVTEPRHAAELAAWLRERHGGLDVLVNNAGVALDGFDVEIVRQTLAVNVYGVQTVTETLLPLMRRGGEIVMVSSGMGELSCLGPALRERLLDEHLTRADVRALLDAFAAAVAAGDHEAQGWPSSAYRVSKAALNAYVRLLARELAPRGIHVNAVCPGWVRTDMGGAAASRSVEEGARGIVWAATRAGTGPSGQFLRDANVIPW